MSQVIIQPRPLLTHPFNYIASSSKSECQRAIALALIRGGTTTIKYRNLSNDDTNALNIIRQLGADIQLFDNYLVIKILQVIDTNITEINVGESGLSARMFIPIFAALGLSITVTGTGSLLNRPFDIYESVLPSLGVMMTSNNGKLPITLKGTLQPKDITIDGSVSSQFITGLLLAFQMSKANDVTIEVTNLNSKPYVDLTINMAQEFLGKTIQNIGYQYFKFSNPKDKIYSSNYTFQVQGDWSSAAPFLSLGVMSKSTQIEGLDLFTDQADKSILGALMDTGARLSINTDLIEISNLGVLKPFHFIAIDCPDLFPALAALAAMLPGKSVLEGTSRLTYKESNRAIAIQESFEKLGITVVLQDDLMIIEGQNEYEGGEVDSYGDHRIVMACAMLALKAKQPIIINDYECIDKSYPTFFNDLIAFGFNCQFKN